MKQAFLIQPGVISVKSVLLPEISDNEILVKNKISLTCGTDVKNYHRGYPLLKPPHPFGHEFAGEVVAVGSKIKNFVIGDRIVAHNSAPCNYCYYCKQAQHSLCDNLVFNRGTYAEYVKIPSEIVTQNMFRIPDDMTYKTAALLEPFSCAVYGVSQISINQGDTVLVIGAGPIGLMFIKLASLKGAKVFVCDLSDYRLEIAKRVGAYQTINTQNYDEQTMAEVVRGQTENKRGYDIVIEATGLIDIWNSSLAFIRKGGEILFFGGTKSGTQLTVDANIIHYEQITLKGIFHTTPRYVEKAFSMLKLGVLDESDFIQNKYSIDDLEVAIREHSDRKVIKNYISYE